MRRAGSLLLTAALLLCAACASDDTEVPPAGLAETYDIAYASDLVFVTSAETNDLKVISPADTDYVRAPNPLEALSIPVVARPDKLARDASYDAPDPDGEEGPLAAPATGAEVTGPYVYVRSASEPLISVVSTAQLREVARIRIAPGGQETAVTAFAARGPTKSDPGHSELYLAIQTQGRGQLLRVVLPANPDDLPPPATPAGPAPELAPELVVPLSFAASTQAPPEGQEPVTVPAEGYGPITAMAVLPGNQLAVATRAFRGPNPAETPLRPFATLKLQMEAAQATVLHRLLFRIPSGVNPGDAATFRDVPVRALVTHAAYSADRGQPQPVTVPAGERIFGLIDEQACADLLRCGGVLAVQSDTGQLSRVTFAEVAEDRDDNGNVLQPFLPAVNEPMLPLKFDDSLPTGFTLALGARPQFGEGTGNLQRTDPPFVGIVAHASGQYFFFDAERLVHYDQDANRAGVRFDGVLNAGGSPRTGDVVTFNPVRVEVLEGYAENESLTVILEGLITPSFFAITDPEKRVLNVPAGLANEVLPGDQVRFYSSPSGVNVCQVNGVAVSVEVAGVSNNTLTLVGDGLIPETCRATASFFQVLSGRNTIKPWVVYSGTVYLGRAGQAGNELVIQTQPRFLAPGFTPGPRLKVSLVSSPLTSSLSGDRE